MSITSYDPIDKILGTSLTLTGTIVHGYGVFIFVGDEGMPTGANWTIEVASWFIRNMNMYKLNMLRTILPFPSSAQAVL